MSDQTRFEDFWPKYLREHSDPKTRALHLIGAMAALSCAGAFVCTRNWWWLPAALVGGYGPAWFSHMTIEGNRPATLREPLLSLRGDFTMLAHALRGTLESECAKAGC
jgi:hypothetical protein